MKPPGDTQSPSIEILKVALRERGMRQQELAQLTGLSKDHVSRILLGKVSFPKSRDTLNAIAQALTLDPLLFKEYREQLSVLPESTRRLVAHLKARGIPQVEFVKRIPQYSEGHLQLILRGGSPFPKDPETIELFAQAAEASPFMFAEYLPLSDWSLRITLAAEQALDRADQGVFLHLWKKLQQHFEGDVVAADAFEDRLLAHFLARAFGGIELANGDAELDDQLSYLPPISAYQPKVRALLRRVWERKARVADLASAAGVEPAVLFAVFNGQMKLKDGPLERKLVQLLEPEDDA